MPKQLVNAVFYKDKPMLEGPYNEFKMAYGTQPSFGFFRCDNTTKEFLTSDEQKGRYGDLVFVDAGYEPGETHEAHPPQEDGTGVGWIRLPNIWVVKCKRAVVAHYGRTTDEDIWDITLADERILWRLRDSVPLDFNTYHPSRIEGIRDVNAGGDKLLLENLFDIEAYELLKKVDLSEGLVKPTTTRLWKWHEILAAIKVPGKWDTSHLLKKEGTAEQKKEVDVRREPRNILGRGIYPGDVLARVLWDLQAFIVPVYMDNVLDDDTMHLDVLDTQIYKFYKLGLTTKLPSGDDTAKIFEWAEPYYYSGDPGVWVNPLLTLPGAVFSAVSTDGTNHERAGQRVEENMLMTEYLIQEVDYPGEAPFSGAHASQRLWSPYAETSGGTNNDPDGDDTLQSWTAEQAIDYAKSFLHKWRDITYTGILQMPLCQEIHEVIWKSTAEGNFTRVKSYIPRQDKENQDKSTSTFHIKQQIPNGLWNYGDFPVGGGSNVVTYLAKIDEWAHMSVHQAPCSRQDGGTPDVDDITLEEDSIPHPVVYIYGFSEGSYEERCIDENGKIYTSAECLEHDKTVSKEERWDRTIVWLPKVGGRSGYTTWPQGSGSDTGTWSNEKWAINGWEALGADVGRDNERHHSQEPIDEDGSCLPTGDPWYVGWQDLASATYGQQFDPVPPGAGVGSDSPTFNFEFVVRMHEYEDSNGQTIRVFFAPWGHEGSC